MNKVTTQTNTVYKNNQIYLYNTVKLMTVIELINNDHYNKTRRVCRGVCVLMCVCTRAVVYEREREREMLPLSYQASD